MGKAKKYYSCIAYISQIIDIIKPENEKQHLSYIKLKAFLIEYENEKANKKWIK